MPCSSASAKRKRVATGRAKNSKGCDIGYALAASSCEEANRVDACTVTALDAITAFAVPNPNCSSQSQSVFSGLVANQVALTSRSPSLLRTGKVLIKPTLSAVDVSHVKQLLHRCQCFFSSLIQISVDVNVENRSESQPRCNSMQENQFNVLTAEYRSRIVVPAHDHKTHVGSGCLCRWRIPRESRSGIG